MGCLTNTVQFRVGDARYPTFKVPSGQSVPANIACADSHKVSLVLVDPADNTKYVLPAIRVHSIQDCLGDIHIWNDAIDGVNSIKLLCCTRTPYIKFTYHTVRDLFVRVMCVSLSTVVPGLSNCVPLCQSSGYAVAICDTYAGNSIAAGTLNNCAGSFTNECTWFFGLCSAGCLSARITYGSRLMACIPLNVSTSNQGYTACCPVPSAAWC